jgi:hypothetical protein
MRLGDSAVEAAHGLATGPTRPALVGFMLISWPDESTDDASVGLG